MKTLTHTLFLLIGATLLSCGSNNFKLKYEDFANKMKEDNTALIDVRTPEEYEEDFIEGAINIDYKSDNFKTELAKLDKDKTYLLYCLRGSRSGKAAEIMKSLGFNNVYDLQGGINTWKIHKQPVVSNKKPEPQDNAIVPFNKAMESDKLVMVDFTAVWCGPCQKMKPFIHKLRDEMKDSVLITEVDVDGQPDLARDYQISSMPTLVFFKDGKEINRTVGYRDETDLRRLIVGVLNSSN